MRLYSLPTWGILATVLFLGGCAETSTSHAALLQGQPQTIWDDGALLARVKTQFAAGVGPRKALDQLLREADEALTLDPPTVMSKAHAGPSGDKHDYVSYAPYFWPNPDTKDGLPYVRHDGHRNQEAVANGDANSYRKMQSAVHALGLAYWFTGKAAYATKAAALVRAWFITPATRMNPNFQYAQAILGTVDGRGIGLIENRGLLQALDGVTLIKDAGVWSADDQRALHDWVLVFDKWMTTSPRGRDEMHAQNNHGSWYAVQEAGLYLWLGEQAKAREVFLNARARIVAQIEPTGRQPLEIAREDGFGYSVFNVQALSMLATMAERQGVDLWHFQQDGRGLQRAIDYLMPFANGSQKWTDKQLKKIDAVGLEPVIAQAVRVYGEPRYAAWLAALPADQIDMETLLTGR